MATVSYYLRRDFAEEMGLGGGLALKAKKQLPKQVIEYAASQGRSPFVPPLVAYYVSGINGVLTADGRQLFAVPVHFFEEVIARHTDWVENLLRAGVSADAAAGLSIRATDRRFSPVCALHNTRTGRLSFVETQSVLPVLLDQYQLLVG